MLLNQIRTLSTNWKLGLAAGAGLAVGAIGIVLIAKSKGGNARKACAAVLSHGIDVKDKVLEVLETAKESIEDLTAEARHESDLRREEVEGEVIEAEPVTKV